MAGISFRTDRTGQRNSPVTARCIAIVLGPDRSLKIKKDRDSRVDPITGQEILDEKPVESEKRPQDPPSTRQVDSSNGKEIFEEFKVRNRTCYWNPALVESVKNLEYLGFVEPCTLLVGGEDIHLENVRTAWGRHVLKPPANFVIEKIGDVGGIQMQVVPQTQFIPLPESLCLIIMDLNNNRIIATLDLIRERLTHCYGPDMQLPNDQLIYDTLGQLIRERKVFHTGSGYFVVTPDTYRLRTDDHSQTYGTAMVQYHPMYIPVPHFSHLPPGYQANRAAQMRTISCQTRGDGDQPARGRVKLERSHSMKGSKGKDLPQKECVDEPELKRSMSVKYKTERGKTVYEDINLKNSNLNQEKDKGEKVSLLSKLFGKGKKKAPPPPPVKEVEYASFSAQFPPPEWQWYQQQIEKHRRVEDWVKNQIPKSETWHYLQAPPYSVEYKVGQPMAVFAPGDHPQGQFIPAPCPVHSNGEPEPHAVEGKQRAATLPPHRHSKRKQGRSKSLTRPDGGRHKNKSELTRSAERLKLSYESCENGSSSVDVKENADPQLQGAPHPLHPLHSFMSIDEHPYGIPYHSTPREPGVPMPGMPMLLQPHPSYMDDSYQPRKGEMLTEQNVTAHSKHDSKEPHYNRRAYKAKKKQQRASENHRRSFNEGDISYEYQGKLPKKESSFAVSCESGVNFVGQLGNDEDGKPGHVSSHPGQASDGQPGCEGQGRGGQGEHGHSRHKSYLMNNSVMKKSHRHKHRGHREKCIPEESELKAGDDSAEIEENFKAMNVEKVDVCVHRNFEDSRVEAQITTNAISTTGSSGEAINSTSGQSCDTVQDTHKHLYSKDDNKPGENVTMDGKEVSVGDSGFGSPRNVEVSPDNKFSAGGCPSHGNPTDNSLPQTKHGLNILRNTDRTARKYPQQHRSSSGSAYASHIGPYTNGCPIPLNNQRPVSKETNIDTAHKQRPKSQGDMLMHPYPSQNDMLPYQYGSQGDMLPPQYSSQNVMDEKLLQVSRKFQMEGDFEVVGVV